MSKRIVYTIIDSGVDGREKSRTVYASFLELERDERFDKDPSKAWKMKGESIVDVGTARAQALAKLDGLDKLVLGLVY